MTRLSSNWTIFYKFFIPIVWIVFFGVIIVGGLINFNFTSKILVLSIIALYLGFVALWAFTAMRLKRVECTDEHFYITNYFRTYRYTFDSLSRVKQTDLIVMKIVRLIFKEKSSFGKNVFFLRRKHVWEENVHRFPDGK